MIRQGRATREARQDLLRRLLDRLNVDAMLCEEAQIE
jgi:hypothetical protein